MIYIAILLSFALTDRFQREEKKDISLYDEILLIFAKSLGAYDTPETGEERKTGAATLFYVLNFVTNLVSLNSLIAILADSYEKVRNDENVYDMREKIELLSEINSMNLDDRHEFYYINIIRYVSQEENSEDQWEGKMNKI